MAAVEDELIPVGRGAPRSSRVSEARERAFKNPL